MGVDIKTKALNLNHITGTFGVEVAGIEVSAPVSEDIAVALRDALREHKVLVLRNQLLVEPWDLLAFGCIFGDPETAVHPSLPAVDEVPAVKIIVSNSKDYALTVPGWHTDGYTRDHPHWISLLQAVDVPPYGRDTVYADMEAAYSHLSPTMQTFLDGLTALNSWGAQKPDAPPVEHPVVMVDHVNGRKSLYISELYTRSIVGMRPDESQALLQFLFDQTRFSEFQLRVAWHSGTIVVWDNLKVQHYAVKDQPYRRVQHRVMVLSPE